MENSIQIEPNAKELLNLILILKTKYNTTIDRNIIGNFFDYIMLALRFVKI